jgi:peptidoglycan/xylan/chitin deacetylase (PgdA/CDA1 family)
VIEAGMTVGTHTWSHKDLARNPYAKDIEQAKQEIEMGISAVHMAAAGGKVAPFFRFPDLQHPPQLMSYLAERNIAVFSTDIDSRDFKLHKPEEVIKSVMSQLEKHGKGIILMHDFHRNTAEALPELIRQFKRAASRWCTWCRRARSPQCRSTTKWSGNRTSFRLTIPGLKVALYVPLVSRIRLYLSNFSDAN